MGLVAAASSFVFLFHPKLYFDLNLQLLEHLFAILLAYFGFYFFVVVIFFWFHIKLWVPFVLIWLHLKFW
jgi:hypothetical protein